MDNSRLHVQHYYTTGTNDPDVNNLELGEIAVGANNKKACLYFKDKNNTLHTVGDDSTYLKAGDVYKLGHDDRVDEIDVFSHKSVEDPVNFTNIIGVSRITSNLTQDTYDPIVIGTVSEGGEQSEIVVDGANIKLEVNGNYEYRTNATIKGDGFGLEILSNEYGDNERYGSLNFSYDENDGSSVLGVDGEIEAHSIHGIDKRQQIKVVGYNDAAVNSKIILSDELILSNGDDSGSISDNYIQLNRDGLDIQVSEDATCYQHMLLRRTQADETEFIVYLEGDRHTGTLRFYTDQGNNGILEVNDVPVSLEGHTHSYLPLSGGTLTGSLTAPSFYETSDERLKTFGDDIKVDFEKLSKLRKSYFTFNDDSDKQHIGVSAQEVKEIYPEIVSENENGYLSVDYSKLSVIALKAVDELYKEVSEIKEMLKEIKNSK